LGLEIETGGLLQGLVKARVHTMPNVLSKYNRGPGLRLVRWLGSTISLVSSWTLMQKVLQERPLEFGGALRFTSQSNRDGKKSSHSDIKSFVDL